MKRPASVFMLSALAMSQPARAAEYDLIQTPTGMIAHKGDALIRTNGNALDIVAAPPGNNWAIGSKTIPANMSICLSASGKYEKGDPIAGIFRISTNPESAGKLAEDISTGPNLLAFNAARTAINEASSGQSSAKLSGLLDKVVLACRDPYALQ